jgi:hypothetical protein
VQLLIDELHGFKVAVGGKRTPKRVRTRARRLAKLFETFLTNYAATLERALAG